VPEVGASDRKPKTKYTIVRENAAWVVLIFNWFVLELRSLAWIAKELNRLGVPKDHRASTKEWRPEQLPALLRNKKFIGQWAWGKMKNVRDPMTGQTRQEPRSPEEYAKWSRTIPELQIVDESIFDKAQYLLRKKKETHAPHRDSRGKLRGSSPQSSAAHPKHLLHGLLKCAECGRQMVAGGSNGKYMVCKGNRLGVCSCKTAVRRSMAERLILEAICERILLDPSLRNRVFEIASRNWELSQQNAPSQRRTLEDALADVERRIARLVDKCERMDAVPEFATRIGELRTERDDFKQKLKQIDVAECRSRKAPTIESVDEELANLRSLLSNQGPAAAIALRNLVGGNVLMSEVRLPNRKRHFLRGRLALRLYAIATDARLCTDADPADGDAELEEIEIDFRLPNRCEQIADKVMCLWDAGSTDRQIAAQLDCGRALVNRGLQYWYDSRGQQRPDGRSCRKRLPGRRKAEQMQERIMQLFQDDTPILEIARALDCCPEIVREAVEKWHTKRGLPTPDGRARRRDIRLRHNSERDQHYEQR
jgi:site-specific DNA recombinase